MQLRAALWFFQGGYQDQRVFAAADGSVDFDARERVRDVDDDDAPWFYDRDSVAKRSSH